ncbi:MAG: DUF4397 domain-containing protein [Vicinamibacterales bacterium]
MRIVSTLALAALLSLSASAAEAARVFIIHGIPGVTVDVYATLAGAPIPATPTIPGFQPKQIVDLTAGPATVDIRVFAQGADPQTATPVIAVLGAAVPASGEISILAHLDGAGTPTASIYTNDASAPLAGAARVSVRHAAQAPAVQLAAGGVPKLAVTNPYFGDLEVPAGVGIPLQLQVPFTGAAVTPEVTLSFNAGMRYFVYAIGSLSGGTFDFIVQAVQ